MMPLIIYRIKARPTHGFDHFGVSALTSAFRIMMRQVGSCRDC